MIDWFRFNKFELTDKEKEVFNLDGDRNKENRLKVYR